MWVIVPRSQCSDLFTIQYEWSCKLKSLCTLLIIYLRCKLFDQLFGNVGWQCDAWILILVWTQGCVVETIWSVQAVSITQHASMCAHTMQSSLDRTHAQTDLTCCVGVVHTKEPPQQWRAIPRPTDVTVSPCLQWSRVAIRPVNYTPASIGSRRSNGLHCHVAISDGFPHVVDESAPN